MALFNFIPHHQEGSFGQKLEGTSIHITAHTPCGNHHSTETNVVVTIELTQMQHTVPTLLQMRHATDAAQHGSLAISRCTVSTLPNPIAVEEVTTALRIA